MKRILLLVAALFTLGSTATFAQTMEEQNQEEPVKYKYAYVSVDGKVGKKLKVFIDLGGEAFPVKNQKEVAKMLRKSRSYAAVINFMVDHGYEVVNINQAYEIAGGSGGSAGITAVMRKAILVKPTPVEDDSQIVAEEEPTYPEVETTEEAVEETPVEETTAPVEESTEETPVEETTEEDDTTDY